MRRTAIILAAALAAMPVGRGFAASDETGPAPVTCGGVPGGMSCFVSKKDLKEARTAFNRGVNLSKERHMEEALEEFDTASRLSPQNPQYLTARDVVRGQLAFDHVQRGNALMLEHADAQAAAEFRKAIDLDFENEFARERLAEATQEMTPLPRPMPLLLEDSGEIHLKPTEGRATFHYTGEIRGLYEHLGAAFGIKAQFDESVQPRNVVFNVDSVDFFTALKLAGQISKTMWAPLDAHQMLIATDNVENHKQFDRMSLRTFILPAHSSPQEATDLVTTMRNMFDLHFVSSGQTSNMVEVRGPAPLLAACTKLMEQLSNDRPQVMLDVKVYQINHQLTRNMGVHIPNTFNLYNIPEVALVGLGGQSISQLINQLISSGGINQLGSTALSGLLAQLGGQGNSIFSQPLATFGGGLTFMGLSLDQFVATLSVNESWVRSLENMSMRASQGNDATFHLGEKYPIQNASYAPIYNSAAISQVLGNQTYVPPFPSVSYEDLGLNLKAKPAIHGDNSVSLALELQVRSLTGQSNNGVPVISNREYKGSILLNDGEPAVIAGEVSESDMLSMSGIPGFGFIPGLNQVMTTNTKQVEQDELLIVITPHVVANINRTYPEIWISQE